MGKRTHGMSRTETHRTWVSMIARCENPKFRSYASYGGRGISVCPEWHSFETFVEDMGVRPHGKQLDRIDNNKGYSRGNCRWVTPQENSNNRRSNRFIEHNGKQLTLAQWAREFGTTPTLIANKLKRGWSMAQIEEFEPRKKQTLGAIYGENLKKMMSEKKISGRRLGALAGLSSNTVHLIITNQIKPSLNTAVDIADALDVSIGELLGEATPDHSLDECFARVHSDWKKRRPKP